MTIIAKPIPIIDRIEFLETPNSFSNIFSVEDYYSSVQFLKQYNGNSSTFESYRREVEKILQWSWRIKKKSILELSRVEIEEYISFCLSPPSSWISIKNCPRFLVICGERKPNKNWKPFLSSISKANHKKGEKPTVKMYSLSQKSIQEIFSTLSSFFNFLLLEGKVSKNPIALIKQKSKYLQKRQKKNPVMRLTEKQWETCINEAQKMATENKKNERLLFIMSCLYLLYLRVSELTATFRWTPQMNHFYQDSSERWWFKVVGKGNKMREIAVSDSLIESLKRYRKSLGLSDLPSPKDSSPLIPKERGNGPMTSPRRIRQIVQLCFDRSVQDLKKNNYKTEAQNLEEATVHWLRHTGISDDINKRGRPVSHVRDDAGHSTSATTDRYNDIEMRERHTSAKKKKTEISKE